MNKYTLLACLMCAHIVVAKAQDARISKRVDSVLRLMTLQEKIGQLNQYSGREVTGPASERKSSLLNDIKSGLVGSVLNVKGVKDTREIQAVALQSRLKIPLLFSLDVIHGYKTVFPVPLAEAASWNMDLIQQSAHIAAKEAAASGIHWTFAPMVDIARDPRWGRVMEGAGEDTYLGSAIAKARVIGFQGKQLGGVDAVMACAKHFAAYGAAFAGRDYNPVDMSEEMLHQVYLPPFKAAADAGVATFMNSFNTLNGVPATASSYLQRDILKGKWNYQGFVVSDWGSIREMIPWGYAINLKEAAESALNAGSDMDMESDAYKKELERLVNEGRVKVDLINDAVRRILYKKFELGLFDDPYKFSDFKREAQVMNDKQHALIARSIAEQSIVLLKNQGDLLPIKAEAKKIALIGPLVKAKADLASTWTVYADTSTMTNVYDGLIRRFGERFTYARGCGINDDSKADIDAAVQTAMQSDLVVMVLGEAGDMTGEAKSRADLNLPGQQMALFEAIKATGKPVAVILMAGRPLVFNAIAEKADAVVYALWLGAEAGNAIANVLSGGYNPSGKLPMTFPRSVGQIPLFYNHTNTGRPVTNPADIRYRSAYIDSPNTPQYAFGYGLSYTKFAYTDLKIDQKTLKAGEKLNISFTLTNTGGRDGAEVVQLYLQDRFASSARPVKELKDFKKLMLKAGESKQLSFVLNPDQLAFYKAGQGWITEPGAFKLMLGGSSDQIQLQTEFTLQ
jgi:beta-glucosidase